MKIKRVKIKKDKKLQIAALHKDGVNPACIAKMFGLSCEYVEDIIARFQEKLLQHQRLF
jgi:transposase